MYTRVRSPLLLRSLCLCHGVLQPPQLGPEVGHDVNLGCGIHTWHYIGRGHCAAAAADHRLLGLYCLLILELEQRGLQAGGGCLEAVDGGLLRGDGGHKLLDLGIKGRGAFGGDKG